jgi:single-strand DNA-binding protein
MSTVNKVVLLGNVGTVEVKEFETGKKLVQVSLATSDGYKKNEEWVEKTEWHKCVFAIPNLAERATKISKGDKIYVEGSISTQSWTNKDGEKKEYKEIACTMFKTFSKAASSEDKASKPAFKKQSSNDDIPF